MSTVTGKFSLVKENFRNISTKKKKLDSSVKTLLIPFKL